MVLWWIGNAVLLVLVAPLLVALLRGVLVASRTVRRASEDVAAAGSAIVADLGPISQLRGAERDARATRAGLVRYGAALEKIL